MGSSAVEQFSALNISTNGTKCIALNCIDINVHIQYVTSELIMTLLTLCITITLLTLPTIPTPMAKLVECSVQHRLANTGYTACKYP